ncbi:MAG: hypothetical protein JXB13_11935 [Phycisphaerae bacterium]|nr:hypothetical protein [Phycisphaerae bacterium]
MHTHDTQDAKKKRFTARGRGLSGSAAAVAMLTCLQWASPLLAQESVGPPQPSKPVFQWLFALGITIVCIAVAFKNPRRSHLG